MRTGISPRLALVIIASLFILPLALAWLMYSGVIDYDPVETRNLGKLVEPPVPVSFDSLVWHSPESSGEKDLSGRRAQPVAFAPAASGRHQIRYR